MTPHTLTLPGVPNIDSAESCESSASNDLHAGTVLGLIAGINVELALLNIRPDATAPIALVAGAVALPFLHNAWANYQLAAKHRAGISVPG